MREEINILIIEDDQDINNLLTTILKKQGYNVKSAYSGTEGQMCIEMFDFQLILLDLMLPGIMGEELVKKIRQNKNMPIIVISAKNDQKTKVDLLKAGGDDFVSKPFDVNEVVARVEAQLRRYIEFNASNNDVNADILTHKNLVLDKNLLEARINGNILSLTSKEFSILELLMSYPNKVFTRANIFEKVWNDEFFGDDNTVNVHMSNIRSKLNKFDEENDYIKTVWGFGFKLSE